MPSALTAWGLSLTLAGLLSLSASPALALGLGRAKMLSKQGECLLVEFDVESLSPEEQQGLEVSLAEAATYSALGAPFDAVLSSAQARLAKRPNGQLYLSVTSKDPVNQSFLDVILQLHWSTGQVTKEMGLLLDTTQSASLNESGNITQVPVNPGDTASELALRYKNASVTLDQMLMGLLRSNPNAFLAQNVNRLRADANLVLPSTEEALSLKAQDASAQVQLQHIDFDQYRAALVAKLQQGKPRAEKNSKQNASGQVGSKAKAPREKKDQLKLSDANAASAKVADQLAQEAQAKIDAQKAQDLSQNIQELNTLAKHAGPSWSVQSTLINLGNALTQAWAIPKAWLSANAPQLARWLEHPLAPVWAGLGLGILVLGTLWGKRSAAIESPQTPEHDMDHQPWLDPESTANTTPPIWAQVASKQGHSDLASHLDPEHGQNAVFTPSPPETGATPNPPFLATSLSDHVRIDFDLDLPPLESGHAHEPLAFPTEPTENPLQVRFELAQELWQVGQQHTARAIVQEIAQQATGELLSTAHAWLAERG